MSGVPKTINVNSRIKFRKESHLCGINQRPVFWDTRYMWFLSSPPLMFSHNRCFPYFHHFFPTLALFSIFFPFPLVFLRLTRPHPVQYLLYRVSQKKSFLCPLRKSSIVFLLALYPNIRFFCRKVEHFCGTKEGFYLGHPIYLFYSEYLE